MLGSFGEHSLESEGGSLGTDVVAVDERRVAEHGRLLAEVFLDFLHLFLHVGSEGLFVGKRRQSVAIGLGEELHATGLVEFLQLFEYLRGVHLQLFDTRSRKRECHLECLAVLLNHLLQGVQGRHVGALGDVGDGTFVLVVVVVIMVGTDVEETVALEMNNLMYLKI